MNFLTYRDSRNGLWGFTFTHDNVISAINRGQYPCQISATLACLATIVRMRRAIEQELAENNS